MAEQQTPLQAALAAVIEKLQVSYQSHSQEARRHLATGAEQLASAEATVAFTLAELLAAFRQAASSLPEHEPLALPAPAREAAPPVSAEVGPAEAQPSPTAPPLARCHTVKLPASLGAGELELVIGFAEALGRTLAWRRQQGGAVDWTQLSACPTLRRELMEAIGHGNPLDVAVLCAFLWHHGAFTNNLPPLAVEQA